MFNICIVYIRLYIHVYIYICVCVCGPAYLSTYHGTEDTGVMLFSVNDYNEEPKQTVDDIGDIESQNYMGI